MSKIIFLLSLIIIPNFIHYDEINDVDQFISHKQKNTSSLRPFKNIVIGDSQTPYVDWGSQSFKTISETAGTKSLWQGGKSLSWLVSAVRLSKVDSCVSNVAICIGTNGAFNKRDSISTLVDVIKIKFPLAKLFVIQGSWGWGGVSNKTEQQVRDYYLEFSKLGVVVVEPPIGKIEPHGKKPIYKKIGHNLDSLVSQQIELPQIPTINKNPKSILIIGDSQCAIKNASGKNITYTYPNILKKKLQDSITIDVLALGGKTTSWMLLNLPDKLKQRHYDRVIIHGGGNDCSNSSIPLEVTFKNIQKIVDLSLESGSDVFINLGYKIEGRFGNIDILPVGRPSNLLQNKWQWLPYIEKRKDFQRLLPLQISGCNFIPVYDLVSNTQDGIHPNSEGHKISATYILNSIKNN
jgi:lysophospholipase L1-like esterase